MIKAPGTPSSTGLLHMPFSRPPVGVTYQQRGGFGPFTRDVALEAAKIAALVGRSKPTRIWVQRPHKNLDNTLAQIIALLDAAKVKYTDIFNGPDALAGFGVYYQYGDKVIMEHTSDPESKVLINGNPVQKPHVHIEVVGYTQVSTALLPMSKLLKEIPAFKIFDNTTTPPTVRRLERLKVADPSVKEPKESFNHHIYYNFP